MVEKRSEATLLLGEDGVISGILTDKDIAFRVVAAGLNPESSLPGARRLERLDFAFEEIYPVV